MTKNILALVALFSITACHTSSRNHSTKTADLKPLEAPVVAPAQTPAAPIAPAPQAKVETAAPEQKPVVREEKTSAPAQETPAPVANPAPAPAQEVVSATPPQPAPTQPTKASPAAADEVSNSDKLKSLLDLVNGKNGDNSSSASSQNPKTQDDLLNEKKAAEDVGKKLDEQALSVEKKDSITNPEKKKWFDLVEYVADNGEATEAQAGYYVSLADVTSKNQREDHVGRYLSVVGGMGGDGNFAFSRIEGVYEDWKNKNENLVGELWMFLLSRDGEIAKTMHKLLTVTADGRHVIEDKYLDFTPEQAQAKFVEFRDYWYKRMEANPGKKSTRKAPTAAQGAAK